MDHPLHLHVNPMQVISRNGRSESVRVRTQFSDFAGKSMYHCHILDHEELGMMGNILIEGLRTALLARLINVRRNAPNCSASS